jgi:hypothetical protein
MPVVLGYGSLLNTESLQRTLPGKRREDLRPVLVPGFRRLFNLIMLSQVEREADLGGQAVGALNAVVDPAEELGAVAFSLTEEEFGPLDRREYCYFKIKDIPIADFYTGESLDAGLLYSVYPAAELEERFPERYRGEIGPLGGDGITSSEILPGDAYLTLCLQGAYSWGEDFGVHFLDHSFLADGRIPLREYLDGVEVRDRLGEDIGEYLRNR